VVQQRAKFAALPQRLKGRASSVARMGRAHGPRRREGREPMIDSSRRTVLTAGAAAAAASGAPPVFAQAPQTAAPQGLPAGLKVGFYERGNVRIRYAEIGSGFPLLATPGGGLNSRMSNWPTAVINIPDELKNDFRVITMDQRNANNGESTGPVPVEDPWDAFADDQLGVMDHLGIRQFFFFGNCIGGPFAFKLMERAPGRVVAAILSQPVGHRPDKPDYMYESGRDVWAKEFLERRPDVSMATIELYLHNLYRVQPDFVYSVSRDFAKSCQTPMLVLPDDVVAHPLAVAIDIASLAPNAEITVFPWKEPPELKARTINRVRTFLKRHQTA
jgi:pimeloyl-ACP methyl ester carboxylesterase